VARRPEPFEVVAPHAEEDEQGRINVMLPEAVREDRALMRWLHHRVVDLLAEKGLLGDFADDVEVRLSALGTDIVSDYVGELLTECQTARPRAAAESVES
jgi:hypothetical protein